MLPQINENVSGGTESNEHLLHELLRLSSERIGQRHRIGEHQVVAPSTPLSNPSRPTAATAAHAGVARHPETSRIEERQYSSHRLCTIASSSRATPSSQMYRTQSIAGASGINDSTFRYLFMLN